MRRYQAMPSTNGGDIEFTERMSAASDVGQGDTEVSLVTNAPDVTQSLLKLGRRTDSLLDGRCKHEARKARPWLPSRCIDDGSGNLGPGKAPATRPALLAQSPRLVHDDARKSRNLRASRDQQMYLLRFRRKGLETR
jgi:hypothetical protein